MKIKFKMKPCQDENINPKKIRMKMRIKMKPCQDENVNPKMNNNGPDIATKKSKATHDLWLPGMFKLENF